MVESVNETMKVLSVWLRKLSAYYVREVPPEAIEVYGDELAMLPPSELDQAFRDHLSDPERGRFFPTVADLVAQLGGTSSLDAAHAWRWYLEGKGDSVAALVGDVLGGRHYITHADQYRDLPHIRREFVRLYAQQRQADVRAQMSVARLEASEGPKLVGGER